MKFSTLAFASVVAAGVIDDALKGIDSDINALDKAVSGYSGDKAPLVSAAQKLISDIKSATTATNGASPLTQDEALALISTVQTINSDGDKLSKDLIGKKDDVQKAGECSTVRGIASDLTSNSQALIKAVVSKTPDSLQTAANSLAGQLTTTLQKAQDAFSESNCKDSGSKPSGGSSAAPSSAAPSGAPSSAAPSGAQSSAAPSKSAPAASSAPAATASGPATVPTGAAGALAPGALIAAAVAALAL